MKKIVNNRSAFWYLLLVSVLGTLLSGCIVLPGHRHDRDWDHDRDHFDHHHRHDWRD